MNQFVDVFLKEVLEKVKCKSVHPYLAQELNDHIELLKEDIMEEEGVSEEVAYQKAVEQMGAPDEIGEGLHKTHKPLMEWGIICITIAMILLGNIVLMKYMSLNQNDRGLMLKQAIIIGIATVIVIHSICKLKYTWLEKLTYFMYIMGIILMFLTLNIGIEVNGIKQFLAIGPVMFRTDSVIVPLFLIAFAGLVRKWGNGGIVGNIKLILAAELAVGMYCLLQYFTKAMILAVTIIGIYVAYTYTSEFKGNREKVHKILRISGALSVLGVTMMILITPHRMERMQIFMQPEKDLEEIGYMYFHLRETLTNAKWFGNTWGDNPILYIGGHTELVFNFIIGSMGIIAALIVVVCAALLSIRCFKIANTIRDNYGRLIVYGISTYFAVSFIMNISFNLGLIPMGMCSLPFVSYGGTETMINMIMLGLTVSIYRYKDIVPYELLNGEEEKISIKNFEDFKNLFRPEN